MEKLPPLRMRRNWVEVSLPPVMQVTSTGKQVKGDVVDQSEAILEKLCHRESAIYRL
jgi:hypothetical protein